jgi:acylpyruvate hydrolase
MSSSLSRSYLLPGLDLEARTVYCIGRNYAEHAKELGNAVPAEPVVFIKPRSSLVLDGGPIQLPVRSRRVDHECEIVVALGAGGRNFSLADAEKAIAGYAVGIDVTARDLQDEAKKKALPWAVSKGFESFAPVGRFVPSSRVLKPEELSITLEVRNELRQKGAVSQMLWGIPHLIAHLSRIFLLESGDLIFTGTPPGVGPLHPGDSLQARLFEKGTTLTELFVDVEAAAEEERSSS